MNLVSIAGYKEYITWEKREPKRTTYKGMHMKKKMV